MTPATPSTVLIVDDDPFIRRLIATTLEDVSGFELIQAGDGEEALTLADETHPRIVMLTAGVQHERAAHDAGADLFLTKPFSPLDLLRLVDELAS